jgi:hypothetical protein
MVVSDPQSPSVGRPVDAVYVGKDLDGPSVELFSSVFGPVSRTVILRSPEDSVLGKYLDGENRDRPFIIVGGEGDGSVQSARGYLESHPEHGDRLVASYSISSSSDICLADDVRARIGEFIGTRTYCLRERVDGEERSPHWMRVG